MAASPSAPVADERLTDLLAQLDALLLAAPMVPGPPVSSSILSPVLGGSVPGALIPGPTESARTFEVLSDLAALFETAGDPGAGDAALSPESLKHAARSAEDALASLLARGAAPPIRRLACACLVLLFERGHPVGLFSRVSDLQGALAKTVNAAGDPTPRLGALECLAALCRASGRQLLSRLPETAALAERHARKGDIGVRAAALGLAAAALAAVGDAAPLSAQSEVLRAAAKAAGSSKPEVREGGAQCLVALAASWSEQLWDGGAYAACVGYAAKGLEDSHPGVRAASAAALGGLAAAAVAPPATAALKAAKSEAKRAALAKILDGASTKCLVTPFECGGRLGRAGTAGAWVAFLRLRGATAGQDATSLVAYAPAVLALLGDKPGGSSGGGPGAGAGSPSSPGWEATDDGVHAQACIIYALRAGLCESLPESGQRLLLPVLCDAAGEGPPLRRGAALHLAAQLLQLLGEVPADAAASVGLPLWTALRCAPTASLRAEAALALRELATAAPAVAGKLLARTLDAVNDRVGLGVGGAGAAAGGGGDASADVSELSGYALLLGALVAAGPSLALGLPSSLPLSALGAARALVLRPTRGRVPLACAEREAGMQLLAALTASLPTEALAGREAELLELWMPPFGADAASRLAARGADGTFAHELRWRAAALEAMASFARAHLTTAGLPGSRAASLRPLITYLGATLQGALDLVGHKFDPAIVAPAAGASALYCLRLLQAYAAMPGGGDGYASAHRQLLALATAPLRDVAALAASAPGGESAGAWAALRGMLDRGDASLGPWLPGDDPAANALAAFDGGGDAPVACVYRLHAAGALGDGSGSGSGSGSGPTVEPGLATWEGGDAMAMDLPAASLPLSGRLLCARLALLSRLLKASPEAEAVTLCDDLTAGVRSAAKRWGDKQVGAASRAAALSAAAVAGLAALKPISPGAAGPPLVQSALALARAILADTAAGPAHRRAAAELFASVARAGGETTAVGVARALLGELVTTGTGGGETGSATRGALALALGATHRAVGGMALAPLVRASADALAAAATAGAASHGPGDATLAAWSLHALALTAEAAGPSFGPHVRPALSAALAVLLQATGTVEEAAARAATGRLVNALVVVLGPEMAPGSSHYAACGRLITQLRTAPEPAARLELVRYAQQLTLFSPAPLLAAGGAGGSGLGGGGLLPMLRSAAAARHPAVRAAAAACLRHLAERDPLALLASAPPGQLESLLFGQLDAETGAAAARDLRRAVRCLAASDCVVRPLRWVQLTAAVALATTTPAATAADAAAGTAVAGDAEDDDGVSGAGGKPAAGGAASSSAPPGGIPGAPTTPVVPRWRTRMFAADCLRAALEQALGGGDGAASFPHFDLAAARAAGGSEWLVMHLQQLVEMGYKVTTGALEAMRPVGATLLSALCSRFASTPDPEYDGHALMEQFTAVLLSALRAALAADASPPLVAAGARLAAVFLTRGLAGDDGGVVARVMTLLATPLTSGWDALEHGAVAERVGAGVRVALLDAHAQLATFAAAATAAAEPPPGGGAAGAAARDAHASLRCAGLAVMSHQLPHMSRLRAKWGDLLRDFLVLVSQPTSIQCRYRPALAGAGAASAAAVCDSLRPLYGPAWPHVLTAACAATAAAATADPGGLPPAELAQLLGLAHLALCVPLTIEATVAPGGGVTNSVGGGGHGNGAPMVGGTSCVPSPFLPPPPTTHAAGAAVAAAAEALIASARAAHDAAALTALTTLAVPALLSPTGLWSPPHVAEVCAILESRLTATGGVDLARAASAFLETAITRAAPGYWRGAPAAREAAAALAVACALVSPSDCPPALRCLAALVGPSHCPPGAVGGLAPPALILSLRLVAECGAPSPGLDAASALVTSIGASACAAASADAGWAVTWAAVLPSAVVSASLVATTACAVAEAAAATTAPAPAPGPDARCSAALAAAITLASLLPVDAPPTSGSVSSPTQAATATVLAVVRAAITSSCDAVAASGMSALRAAVQVAAAAPAPQMATARGWAKTLLASCAADAAFAMRVRLAPPSSGGAALGAAVWSPAGIIAAGEGLKLHAVALAALEGDEPARGVAVAVLLPLLVLAASQPECVPAPLAAMALHLVTHVATAAGEHFRAAATQLSAASKGRLQAALAASAAASAAAPGSAAGRVGPGAPPPPIRRPVATPGEIKWAKA